MATKNFVDYTNATAIVTKISKKLNSLEGALIYRGTVTFANLPSTPTKAMAGYVYNVSDSFTTDARFVEGAGKKYPAGTDVSVADQSTYDAVTPVGSENPSTEGWYVFDNSLGKYVLSADTEVVSGTTYYEYTEIIKLDAGAGFIDVDAINDRIDDVREMITDDAFDSTSAYAIGYIVSKDDSLYKFKAAHTANTDWDPTEVDKVNVIDLIASAEPDSLTTAQVNALLDLLD